MFYKPYKFKEDITKNKKKMSRTINYFIIFFSLLISLRKQVMELLICTTCDPIRKGLVKRCI